MLPSCPKCSVISIRTYPVGKSLCGSFLSFYFFLIVSAAAGQNWFSRPWQLDDGLPHNSVTGIAQTDDGFLWLGSPSGLANFDGVRFRTFDLTNAIYEGNRGVMLMLPSRAGGLWLALNRGAVACLNGAQTRVFTKNDGLADQQVIKMVEAGDGALWVLSHGGQCRIIRGGKVTAVPDFDTMPAGSLESLGCDVNGNVWWLKGGELGVCLENKFRQLAHLGGGQSQLAGAKGGGIWVCNGTHLLRCDAAGRLQDQGEFDPSHKAGEITALMEDSEGAVWIGTAFGGLFRYDGSTFENISTSRPEIQSLFEDREGNIWVGTLGGGLNRVRRRVVQLQEINPGQPFESVRSLCEDDKGTLWATTENGALARHTRQGWESASTGRAWAGYQLTCLTLDPQGGLWIGGRFKKLLHLSDGPEPTLVQSNRLVGTIFSMLASHNGDLWMGQIGTVNGLQYLRDGKLISPELPGDVRTIRAMAQDAGGTVWIGSARGDLLRVQGDKVVRQQIPESDTALSIRCLTPTDDGALWIGFERLGVGWIKDGSYHRVSAESGLFDDYISQIVPDGRGWLWFGSDHGIFKVRQEDFYAVAAGKLRKVESVHYGQGDGVANLQANSGYSPGGVRTHDGRIWIPTRSGLAMIDPAQPSRAMPAPPVLLQQVIVDDKSVAQYDNIATLDRDKNVLDLKNTNGVLELPPQYRQLEIQFTTLSFVSLDNIRFRYRLDGLDQDWQDAGTERRAKYSRLSAGNYRFEVMASNGEGGWNQSGPVLAITVLPYFWQRWWFIMFATLLSLGFVAVTVRYIEKGKMQRSLARLERERLIERERARIAKDIHDDLGTNLTEITLLSELALSADAPAQEVQTDVRRIAEKARALTHSLDEIVWAVNPRNDTLDSFVTYACIHAEDYLRTAGIRCRLKTPEIIPARLLETNVRHNLYLVVKEALNNVVKHAAAGEAVISFVVEQNAFEVIIKDDGRGFDMNGTGTAAGKRLGNGITNMRQRMHDTGGAFDLRSASGQGTTVSIKVRFPEN
jgi:signal transduction histidine kinase/ligand-binding sensor domain-containing protein